MECAFIKSDVCDTGYFASPVELEVSNDTVFIATLRGCRSLFSATSGVNKGVLSRYLGSENSAQVKWSIRPELIPLSVA